MEIVIAVFCHKNICLTFYLKDKTELIALNVRNKTSIDLKGTQKTILAIEKQFVNVKTVMIFDHTKTSLSSGFNNKENDFSRTLQEFKNKYDFEIVLKFKKNEEISSFESLKIFKNEDKANENIFHFLTDLYVEKSILTEYNIDSFLKENEKSTNILTIIENKIFDIPEKKATFKTEVLKKIWGFFQIKFLTKENEVNSLEMNLEQVLSTAQNMIDRLKQVRAEDQDHGTKEFEKKIERLISYTKRRKHVDPSIIIWLTEYLVNMIEWEDLKEFQEKNVQQAVDYDIFLLLVNDAGKYLQREQELRSDQLRIVYTLAFVFDLTIKEVGFFTEKDVKKLIETRNVKFEYQFPSEITPRKMDYTIKSKEKIEALEQIIDSVRYYFLRSGSINLMNEKPEKKSKKPQIVHNFLTFINKDIKRTMTAHNYNEKLYSYRSFGKRALINAVNNND